MGDWDDEHGWRTSVLGRVDWSCWLAVVGLLFVTVISFVVRFPAMGIVMIVLAVLLVAFDSFVNRPGGIRGMRRAAARNDDWSEVREAPSRGDARPPSMRQRNPAPPPSARQPNRRAPGYGRAPQPPQAQPRRAQPPRPTGQPMRQPQPPRPNHAQPGRPNQVPPTRANQPPQPQPYRPAQPPARGREPDYRT